MDNRRGPRWYILRGHKLARKWTSVKWSRIKWLFDGPEPSCGSMRILSLHGSETRHLVPLSPAWTSSQQPNIMSVQGDDRDSTGRQRCHDACWRCFSCCNSASARIAWAETRTTARIVPPRLPKQETRSAGPDGTQRLHVCMILDRCSYEEPLDELGVCSSQDEGSPRYCRSCAIQSAMQTLVWAFSTTTTFMKCSQMCVYNRNKETSANLHPSKPDGCWCTSHQSLQRLASFSVRRTHPGLAVTSTSPMFGIMGEGQSFHPLTPSIHSTREFNRLACYGYACFHAIVARWASQRRCCPVGRRLL